MDSILPYLLHQATNVAEVAATLRTFYNEEPQYCADIGDVLESLQRIEGLIYTVDGAIATSATARTSATLTRDLDLFARCHYHTLRQFKTMFREARPVSFGRPSYAAAWNLMCLRSRDEGCAVQLRLRMYASFLENIIAAIGRQMINVAEMEDIRVRLTSLIRAQPPVDERYNPLRVETEAPLAPHPQAPRLSPPIAMPGGFPSPLSPISNTSGHSGGDEFFPMMASPPQPSTPFGGPSAAQRPHWVTKVFEGRPPRSVFRTRGPRDKCLGRDDPSATDAMRRNGYREVARIPFAGGELQVRLFLRPEDRRGKVVVAGPGPPGQAEVRCCMAISGLKCVRKRSYVELHRINRDYPQPELWASLSFATSEELVLFVCAFSALKSQDSSPEVPGLDDYISPSDYEVVEFAGLILCHPYKHVLRIYRDRTTNSVRLEASPRRGKFAGKPLWTAFVTPFIGSRTWMELDRNIVTLLDLQPFMFCDGYELQRNSMGKYVLTFKETGDARSFYETFHGIRTL